MAAASRRRGGGSADYTWPGYVDALTTLLMVLIFLLSLFSVAQFTLTDTLNTRDSAIEALNKQLGSLANVLSIEKAASEGLKQDLEKLTLQLRQNQAERDRLSADLATQRGAADALKIERDALTERLTSMLAERDRLASSLESTNKEAAARADDLQKEIERQRLELTRLAASLAAANQDKGKLFGDLTEEQKLSAEQKAAVVRLTAELAALKDELARLGTALDAADAKAKDQQAQIVDLGQKLNRALASKVEELARYRSEFFGKLREALRGQRDVQIVGDRFVFQSEVLFPSGSAKLQESGEKQLASVAKRLVEISATIPKDINWVLQVDGHTDNKPISNATYPSNWELSAARAIAVVKFLHSEGIPNNRLVAAGYGEYQPLSSTDTTRNRRIELKLTNR
ncbi:peptidoglycan -binding protein [Reyranella aquatilis]|uniref:Peptidoglycan -binding protein n=1 Tax=Reyranella aquatilis TaxID=2035356 RepID=A0ABS8KQ42_9HYPH|nr:peptidoglycan -binding protein [Reyranella aquatilis]MCC8428183.1 peptidoglycan -binding protein [Reyranella aquatilis]